MDGMQPNKSFNRSGFSIKGNHTYFPDRVRRKAPLAWDHVRRRRSFFEFRLQLLTANEGNEIKYGVLRICPPGKRARARLVLTKGCWVK
jgi:hypothetical protein